METEKRLMGDEKYSVSPGLLGGILTDLGVRSIGELMEVQTMYESPIKIIQGQIKMETESNIMRAVQNYDIHVDKNELLRALQYDRGQYEKGFQDAVLDRNLVEVVHGRWIPIIDEPTPLRNFAMISGYECSICGRYEDEEEPYCNCGAKMDGDGNG